MFKASEGATEGTGLSYLDTPYLGPCKLKSIEKTEINDTPKCFKVTFGDLEGQDYTGQPVASSTTHEHVEWAYDESDDDDKTQKKVDRIAYIAGRLVGKERVEAIEATDWEGYIDAVVQLVKQTDYQNKQLYMKAQGNVWKGKTRVKFPGYRDFLSTVEGDLSWSAKEKASNEEYLEALKGPASNADEDGVVDNVEQATF